jgi:hypothetical protein
MIQYDQFEVLSQNSFDRIEDMIEYSPYSSDVLVKRFNFNPAYVPPDPVLKVEGDPFGYEVSSKKNKPIPKPNSKQEDSFDFPTRCLIVYTPKRSFLKSVGIFWDESKGDSLPIVAYFKDSDNMQKEDVILVDVHDTGSAQKNNLMPRKLKVVDIKSQGTLYQFVKIYWLAPYRDSV